LQRRDAQYLSELLERINFGETIESIKDMCKLLYVPGPEPGSQLIEQFDGYYQLEDIPLAELRARIKIPSEYLGGGSGLATTTQILKQADVVAMLHMIRARYSREVKLANWSYYEPRTEQGSTLSSSFYAMVAADVGRPEWAYRYFMTTATVDLAGEYKRYVGPLYIGGTHPAANGGAWMAAVLGFGGLDFDGTVATIKPAIPSHWNSLTYPVRLRDQQFEITVTRELVRIAAAVGNSAQVQFRVNDQRFACNAGEQITAALAP
jgi:trehalose/maltose hydrolase-like predicted phosphorylase